MERPSGSNLTGRANLKNLGNTRGSGDPIERRSTAFLTVERWINDYRRQHRRKQWAGTRTRHSQERLL